MHFICLQENLKKALNIAERIIGRNLTLPILNNILLTTESNKLKVTSTNLEIGINAWVTGKTETRGSITVPAKLLSDFVNNLPNDKVELRVTDKTVNIKCKKFKATLKGLASDDYPIIPKIKDKAQIKINSEVLKNSLIQVVDTASISDSRPEISGIYFQFEKNRITCAATDTFRLAEKSITLNGGSLDDGIMGQSFIIPQRTIQEIIRIIGEKEGNKEKAQETNIALSESQILFDMNYAQVISRLIEGKYPDYQQIIPKSSQTQVIVNKADLVSSIKIASLFSGKINDVRLRIDAKKSLIDVLAKDAVIGENKSQVPAEIRGDDIEVVFNYRYLLDGLAKIYSEKVIMGLNDNAKPVVIRPVGDNSYSYVVMPIKV